MRCSAAAAQDYKEHMNTMLVMCVKGSTYIYVIAEERAGAILELALVDGTVQGTWKRSVLGELVSYRGVVQAPAPATAVEEITRHTVCVSWDSAPHTDLHTYFMYTVIHNCVHTQTYLSAQHTKRIERILSFKHRMRANFHNLLQRPVSWRTTGKP